VRWVVYAQEEKYGKSRMPPAVTFAVVTIFGLSGFFNSILLVTTRRTSGLFGEFIPTTPRQPIIFFRNEREVGDPQAEIVGSQSKKTKLYDQIFNVEQV